MIKGILAALLATLALALPAFAQGQGPGQAQDQGEGAAPPPTPRLPDGTVNLGGHGIWSQPWIMDLKKQLVGRTELPLLPWTKAMAAYNKKTNVAYDPEGFCLPPGGPRAFGTPYPSQFIQDQQNKRIIVIYEGGAHVWREIFMDGRGHPPKADIVPAYFGHSIGHWEGDTLVVDTVGFNERTWLAYDGTMHTDALHTIEKITRPNRDTLHYEATIDDPEAYAEPFTIAWDLHWGDGQDLQEYVCQENNQFLVDLKDDFGTPFFKPTEGAR
jgi:hypothetical protein